MHRVDDGLPILIEPESSVIAVWWFIALANAFALAVPPGAVARTLVCSCDQPPEAWRLCLFVNLPILGEALAQFFFERVGDRPLSQLGVVRQ